MPDLAYGTSAYSRSRGNLPELPLVNMFVESSPSAEKGVVLQSRPGMTEHSTVGSGPIRGVYQADGVVGGALVVVSGTHLYIGGTDKGAITGSDKVNFAASSSELLINAGGPIYRTDGSTVSAVTFPDSANVAWLVYFAGYFIACRKDTQQLYFSAVLDGTSWNGLDYASAENDPDPLRQAIVVNDTLLLFGSQSVEFWQSTGDATIPVAPIPQRVYTKGLSASGCAVKFDNTAAWIGPTGPVITGVAPSLRVYIAAEVPQGISDPGIEERLSGSTTYALWTFTFEGHEFLVVRLDSGSWLYDAQTRQWCEFQTYGHGNWRVQCAVGGLFGDDTNGKLWKWDTGHVDAGGVLERRFRAGVPLAGPGFIADNVRLLVNVGETIVLSGDYSDPAAEMRTSRDGGRSWGGWDSVSLGAQGNYRVRVEWRRKGMFDDPGMLAEFRCVDPVPFRVSSAKVNEAWGGLSR